jgi:hypothetical protein
VAGRNGRPRGTDLCGAIAVGLLGIRAGRACEECEGHKKPVRLCVRHGDTLLRRDYSKWNCFYLSSTALEMLPKKSNAF